MSSRKLGYESLESRRVCAGNVTINVVAGELRIVGDAAANHITVQQQVIGTSVKYVVRGLRFNGGYTSAGDPVASGPITTVNGSTAVYRIASENIKLFASMGEGNDAVKIGGDPGGVTTMTVPRLKVETGLGDDYVKVDHVEIEGKVTEQSYVQMTQAEGSSTAGQQEAGKDNLIVDGLRIENTDLKLSGGGGNDRIALLGLTPIGAQTDIFFYGGDGDDDLLLAAADLRLGKQLSVFMGLGADDVKAENIGFSRLLVDLGPGNLDTVTFKDTLVSVKTSLRGGTGTDDEAIKDGTNVNLGANPTFIGFEANDFL